MNVSTWELGMLAILALLIFGPERMPEMARNLGRTVARFRREASGTLDELKRAADLDDLTGVVDDLRATTADLKQSASLTGPLASSARPRTGGTSTVQAGTPPPFDPDAT